MTRAEYEAKYGEKPASSSAPAKMTREQYDQQYGSAQSRQGGVGFFQDVANETAKAGVRSFLSIGNLGQGIQRKVGQGIDFLSGGRTNMEATAGGGVFDPASTSGKRAQKVTERQPGAAGVVGTGLAFLGEAAVPGKPVVSAYKAARGTKAFDAVLDAVGPLLRPNEAAQALAKRGGEKTGLFGSVRPVIDDASKGIAETVQTYVPGFKPGGSLVENINAARDAVRTHAVSLKDDVQKVAGDAIYSFKELGSRLRSLERPVLISSDTRLNTAYEQVIAKAMEIAQKNGGKIPSLFDTRKQFDEFVERQFPDLYSTDTLTPMRTAISQVRRAMNDFIDEALPPGTDFKQRLSIQRDLFEAIENMADKATRGQAKEVGKGMFELWSRKHPVASGALKVGGGFLAGKEAMDWLRGQ
jgi:hypothetical protein